MAAGVLRGVYGKLERADKHINDLQAELGAFLGANPYTIGVKYDPDSRDYCHYIARCAEIPDVIPLAVGDAIQCLRSALDHLALLIWKKCNGTGSDRAVYFPISESKSKYESEFPRKIKSATVSVRDAFDAVEPYQEGNGHDLWVIGELKNTVKHRLLISAGNYIRHFTTRDYPGDLELFIPRRPKPLFPLALGDVLLHTKAEADLQEQFAFEVAFNEPGIIERQSIAMTLPHFADVVRNVVAELSWLT